MLKSKRARVLVIVLAAVLVLAASVAVLSQQGYPGGQGQGNQPPMPGQGQMGPGQMGPGGPMGPNQMGPGGGGMGMMGRSNSVAIAATTEYVYVVQGNTLYQFSAKTLKQVNKAELSSISTPNQAPTQ